MTILKRSILFLFLLFTAGEAHGQTSDYRYVQQFKQQYDSLKTEIRTAKDVRVLDSLYTLIASMEEEYKEKEELLNNALYPGTFENSMNELRSSSKLNQARLLVIDNKDEQIMKLRSELQSYRAELNRFTATNDSLQNLIASSKRTERDLRSLVARYRENIKERDEFILGIMDSLLIAHNELSVRDSSEVGQNASGAIISGEENPLNIIESIAEQNLNTLKANPDYLSVEDYLRLYTLQHKVESMWQSIGADLITLYAENEQRSWRNRIDSTLFRWKSSASRNMWASMKDYIHNNYVDLEAFDDNESFYIALDSFIQQAKKENEGMLQDDSQVKTYEQFDQFWSSKIKDEWNPYIQEAGLLTVSQINSIDREMLTWRENALTDSIWVPFLIGLLFISVTIVVVLYVRK